MNHIQMYFGRFLVQRLALLLRALTACSGLNTGRLAGCLWITSEMGRSDMGEFAQQDSDLFRHQPRCMSWKRHIHGGSMCFMAGM